MSVDVSPFEPDRFIAFRYIDKHIEWNADTVVVTFQYGLDTATNENEIVCAERYEFPTPASITDVQREAFDRLTDHLGLVAGISYYKLAAPGLVIVQVGRWTQQQIDAHADILANGLGEFCFVNQLDPDLRPHYKFSSIDATESRLEFQPNLGPLVPVGGGKDSCVTIEALRDGGFDPTLITVNRYPVIAEVITDARLADRAVRRVLDSQLTSFNQRGARNGHVPATAIVSFAVVCAAVLHGHDSVVMSNERSASEGNVHYRGHAINHQWSKSDTAETLLRSLISSEVSGLEYFSLLRPLSELSIARAFARTCGRYFDSFSSCNAAFRLDPARRVSRWCGQCPKCQFVYLALATTLDRETLQRIWDAELFTTSSTDGFRALLGLSAWKPFECVGESGECRVALYQLRESVEWSDHPVVAALCDEVDRAGLRPTGEDRASVFAASPSSSIPARFQPIVPTDSFA